MVDIGKEVKEAGGEPKEAGEGEPKAKLKLRRLKIVQFRNVDPCELHFGDGFNVLLGVNGSGKTTLLNLIAAVLTDDFTGYRAEAFELEYELSQGSDAVVMSIRHRPGKPLVDESGANRLSTDPDTFVGLVLRSPTGEWQASLHGHRLCIHGRPEVNIHNQSATLRYPRTRMAFIVADLPRQNASTDARHPYTSFHSNMGLGRVERFDEGLDFFRTLVASGNEASEDWVVRIYEHNRVQHTESPNLSCVVVNWIGQTFRQAIAQNQGVFRHILLRPNQLPFLQQAMHLMEFKGAELQACLRTIKTDPLVDIVFEYGDFRFMFERAGASIISHDYLSFGQKRLLAFLYYLSCNPDMAVADGLTNGMHPAWIEACVKELSTRQSFLAEQNPMLFDGLEFKSPKDVIHSFVQCNRMVRDQREYLRFSNMSEYDAASVFGACEVGIQHVSEILRTTGLW